MPRGKRKRPSKAAGAPLPAGPSADTLVAFPVGARVSLLPASDWWCWWRAGTVVGCGEAGTVKVQPDTYPAHVRFDVAPANLVREPRDEAA